MIGWLEASLIAALAVAAGLPAVIRAVSLMRQRSREFESHGAANDPGY